MHIVPVRVISKIRSLMALILVLCRNIPLRKLISFASGISGMHINNAKIVFNLHFPPCRQLVLLTMLSFFSPILSGQEIDSRVAGELRMPPDTVKAAAQNSDIPFDTVNVPGRKISDDAVDLPIVYSADGYMKTDIRNEKVSLVKNARVTYGTIELTADSIVLDMETGSVYATGLPDSTGKMTGKPFFKDGSEEFESKELTYNFKSKKGVIRNITTEQEGGYLQSLVTKRHEDESLHIFKSKFTTCDAEDPHFYLALNRAKVYPGEKIVSGPAYMVVADIPLPLIIPFGFFPVQQKRTSGLIMPKYGQEAGRGYYLLDGGYYFAINDYFDFKITGSAYTNGTWTASTSTTYRKRYKFSGSFGFSYANNVSGYKGYPDYGVSSNYRITWSHSQDAKANPGSRFSASVNMSSSGFDRNNSYNVNDHVTTTRQSSISYAKSWAGSPFNFSTSLNHSQNIQKKTVQLNLPKASFSVARFFPLKPKVTVKSKWYHDLQMQYTASLDNKIDTYDSLLFTDRVWRSMQNGFKHEIPVSLQLRPFNNFSISPQMRYTGVMYTRKILKSWDPEYFDTAKNDTVPSVVNDTVRGLFYGQALVPSLSISFNPSLYGTFQFTKEGSRLQAIRHVMRPSVSFSYAPDLSYLASDMYRTVQSDTTGRMSKYSIYDGNIFGTPSLGSKSGSVSFSLANLVEAKVFEKNDTTGKAKKIKLIESLNFRTSYNIFRDSLNWSPVDVSFRTTLADNISFQASSAFNIYALNQKGTVINRLAFREGQGIARMTSFSMSINADIGRLFKGNKKPVSGNSMPQADNQPSGSDDMAPDAPGKTLTPSGSNYDEYGYVRFDMPWSLRMAYSFTYSQPAFKPVIGQTVTLTGDVKLTPKMAVTYNTGYDFRAKAVTVSNIGITRDLHCWQMSFSWQPVGYMRGWYFTLSPKSGILHDLKYERRKDYHEND